MHNITLQKPYRANGLFEPIHLEHNWVSLRLSWHALVQLYKGYFCKALPSVAEGPAYALRLVRY